MQDVPTGFSAIVVSYRTGPVLERCLSALLAAPLCQQIVLVDNGNAPEVLTALHLLTEDQSKLTLVTGQGNIGFGRGCNLGASRADGDNLVFVNPDCILDDGTLAAFGEALLANPVALLGGSLRNEDGSEQRGCRRGELTLWSGLVSFLNLGKVGESAGIWRDFNRDREPFPIETVAMPVVSGALMAIARSTFERVGGFDAAYLLHVEDIDLCVRVRAIAREVLFVPDATALHIGATSDASNWSVARAKINSFSHYFWTHARSLPARMMVIMVMPFLAAAIILRSFFR